MKYRVNLPIVDLTEFECIVEAADEIAACNAAEAAYETYCEDYSCQLKQGSKMKKLDGIDVKFVKFEFASQWIGQDVEIEPATADA